MASPVGPRASTFRPLSTPGRARRRRSPAYGLPPERLASALLSAAADAVSSRDDRSVAFVSIIRSPTLRQAADDLQGEVWRTGDASRP